MICHSCGEREATRFFENFEHLVEGENFAFAWCQSCCDDRTSFYNHSEFWRAVRELSGLDEYLVYEVMEG